MSELIHLPPDKLDLKTQLTDNLLILEKALNVVIDPDNTAQLKHELATRIEMSGNAGVMKEQAVLLYNYAKGIIADHCFVTPQILNAKQAIQKMWIDSRLAQYEAMYERVETDLQKLDNSIKGLITLLSHNKATILSQ